mgnify:CR=1 FL=1
MPELTLKHVPPENRKTGEAYISHDIHGTDIFVDCQIHQSAGAPYRGFIWAIGFDGKKDVRFYDASMRQICLEEFIELVTAKTPQYLTTLLFMIPNPANYFEEIL